MIDDPSAQQQNAPAAPAPPDPNRQLQVSIANLVLGPKLRTELETAVKAEATAQKKDLPQPEIERIAGQVEATFRQQAGQVAGQFIENGMDGNGAADNTVTLILRTAGTSIKTLVASAQPPPKAATPAAETHAAQAKQEKGVFDELGGMLDIGSLFRGGKKKDAE